MSFGGWNCLKEKQNETFIEEETKNCTDSIEQSRSNSDLSYTGTTPNAVNAKGNYLVVESDPITEHIYKLSPRGNVRDIETGGYTINKKVQYKTEEDIEMLLVYY